MSNANPNLRSRSKSLIRYAVTGAVLFSLGSILVFLFAPEQRQRRLKPFCLNNTRNVGTAFFNYYSQNRELPPQSQKNESGEKLFSWRFLLLGMLSHSDLQEEADFEKPWNSSVNQSISEVAIPVLKCPSDTDQPDNGTSLYVITGEETMFPEQEGPELQEVAEAGGQEQTLFLAESMMRIDSWMKPEDIPYRLVTKTPRMMKGYGPSSVHEYGVNVMFADGRGFSINQNIDPDVLRAMITWNGGEEVIPGNF